MQAQPSIGAGLSSSGTKQHPLPLISYTETSYFGRCLALLLGRAPDAPALQLHYESDMAEVLKKLVMEGEGVAWLPRSAIAAELAAGELVPAGPAAWNLDVELRVYRDVSNRVNSWTRSGSTCARRLRGSAESGFSALCGARIPPCRTGITVLSTVPTIRSNGRCDA